MNPTKITGANTNLEPPKDWDHAKDGECVALPIRLSGSIADPASIEMQSAWVPTVDELAVLNNGGYVVLSVIGTSHPPVMLRAELP